MKLIRAGAVLLACLLLSLSAFPQAQAPLIPRSVIFGNPERALPQISPDGKMLAYLAPDQGVLNIWVRTLGKSDDHAITNDRKRGIRNFSWQYDSSDILYTQDQGGDENWRVYQTDMASKQTRDLTPFEKVRADIVALESTHPDEALIQLNKRDPKLFDVYRADLKTGKLALDTENPGDVTGWQADNDLKVRAAQVSTPDGGTMIRVRNNANSPWRELIKWGPEETLGNVDSFTPDNNALLVDHFAGRQRRPPALGGYSDGKAQGDFRRSAVRRSFVVTHPKTNKLEAVVYLRERREFQILDQEPASGLRGVEEGPRCRHQQSEPRPGG